MTMVRWAFRVLAAWLVMVVAGRAATPFSTDATAAFSGWTVLSGNGDPDVSYFLDTSANNGDGDGNGDGDINSANGQAWGLSARDSVPFSGSVILLGYDLAGYLSVGQTLSIRMDTGFIDAGERYVGFELDADGFDRFQFRFQGGDAAYEYGTVGDGYTSTGIGFTDEGLSIAFTLTAIDAYDLVVTRLVDGQTFSFLGQTLGGPAGAGINRVEIFNREAGSGLSNNSYFNNLAVVPEPGTILMLGAGTVALALFRRRR